MRWMIATLVLCSSPSRADVSERNWLGGRAFAFDRTDWSRPWTGSCRMIRGFRLIPEVGLIVTRPDPLSLPGAHRGDVLLSIGRFAPLTPDAALDAYAAARASRWIEVVIERAGALRSLVWVFEPVCDDGAWEVAAGLVPEPICR